jgi:hypothetical protein
MKNMKKQKRFNLEIDLAYRIISPSSSISSWFKNPDILLLMELDGYTIQQAKAIEIEMSQRLTFSN